jgi:peroxiredoxin Q/BCP
VGDIAPDFAVAGVPPATYQLSEQRGKRVVLVFYPGDFTPVCTRQLTSYQEQFDTFAATGAVLWAISVDDLERHERFAKARSLGFPLLADTDAAVSRAFGTLGLLGTSRRAVIVIDEQGRVAWRRDEPLSISYAEMDEIVAHLSALPPADEEEARPAAPTNAGA